MPLSQRRPFTPWVKYLDPLHPDLSIFGQEWSLSWMPLKLLIYQGWVWCQWEIHIDKWQNSTNLFTKIKMIFEHCSMEKSIRISIKEDERIGSKLAKLEEILTQKALFLWKAIAVRCLNAWHEILIKITQSHYLVLTFLQN